MIERASHLTMAQLKERGWTPALVKKFLGPPDATRPNPHYRSASPMQLYASDRVDAIELTDIFQQAQAKALARSQISKTVAARKADELLIQAEQLPITVKRLPLSAVMRRAIASYNAFHEELLWERGHDYERASEMSDPAFLSRIIVNFIRHELTEYDGSLEEVAGRIGVAEASRMIRRRVYAEIARIYPDYASECKRQVTMRHGEDTDETC